MKKAGDYFDHAARQSAEAAAAEREWRATLPAATLRQLDRCERAAHEQLGEEEDAGVFARSEVDIAREVDSEADQLMEEFDLTPGQAEGILEWHRAQLAQLVDREVGVKIGRIAAVLIKPAHDLRVRIYGLAFAARLDALNGMSSQSAAGKELAKHRATVSHWKNYWQRLLGLKDETFGKSPEARRRMSEARRRVVEQQREARRKVCGTNL